MPTITDTLQTVFQMVGLPQYTAGMGQAAVATQRLALANQQLFATEAEISVAGLSATRGISALGGAMAALDPELLAIGAAGVAAAAGLRQAASDSDQLFRAAIAFRGAGLDAHFARIVEAADDMHRSMAIDDEDLVEVAGDLARLGVRASQLEPTLKAIADLSEGTGKGLLEATALIESALVGRGLALKRLGIEFKATGDRARDFQAIVKEIERVFPNAAQGRASLLPGQLDQIKVAVQDLSSAFGNLLAGPNGAALKFLLGEIEGLTHDIERLARFLGIRTNAEQAAKAAGLDANSPAARAARETADNTAEMKKLLRQGFNVGPRGRQAFNTRALRAALRGAG